MGCLVDSNPPVIASDKYNIYVCRGDTVTSSDVGEGVMGVVPFEVRRFRRSGEQYYFLDAQGQLWVNGNLLCAGVRDFNEHHILLADGRVCTTQGKSLQLPVLIAKLCGDLLLDQHGVLYDLTGQYITAQVADAHTDGNEIIVIHQGSRILEYVGDHTDKQVALTQILQVTGARKAVVNQGTVLLLSDQGILIAAGANSNCECGTEEIEVVAPRQLEFPAPVLDFDFSQHVGWALLANHQVHVWGYNDLSSPFFLQWPSEHFITPRLLAC
jgi:hypothetical protein